MTDQATRSLLRQAGEGVLVGRQQRQAAAIVSKLLPSVLELPEIRSELARMSLSALADDDALREQFLTELHPGLLEVWAAAISRIQSSRRSEAARERFLPDARDFARRLGGRGFPGVELAASDIWTPLELILEHGLAPLAVRSTSPNARLWHWACNGVFRTHCGQRLRAGFTMEIREEVDCEKCGSPYLFVQLADPNEAQQ